MFETRLPDKWTISKHPEWCRFLHSRTFCAWNWKFGMPSMSHYVKDPPRLTIYRLKFSQIHVHPWIDITNVYQKSARCAKEGLAVGWGPWLRRRRLWGRSRGRKRRRRNRGNICAAPSYAAILTSWKTSFLSSNPAAHPPRLWKIWNTGSYWSQSAGLRGGEFDTQYFFSVQKPDTISGAYVCQLVAKV